MSVLREEIMRLPPHERLSAALRVIDDLSGSRDADVAALCRRFRLSGKQARIIIAINARAPEPVTREAIFLGLYGHDGGPDPRIIDVLLSRIRRDVPSLRVMSHYGRGWSFARRFDIAELCADPAAGPPREAAVAPELRYWTDEEDCELLRMRANGSNWSAIGEELDRSWRACRQRFEALQSRTSAREVA